MGSRDASGSEDCPFCQIAKDQTDTEILLSVSPDSSSMFQNFNNSTSWLFLCVHRMTSCFVFATWSLAPLIITLSLPGCISTTAKVCRGTTYLWVRETRAQSRNCFARRVSRLWSITGNHLRVSAVKARNWRNRTSLIFSVHASFWAHNSQTWCVSFHVHADDSQI